MSQTLQHQVKPSTDVSLPVQSEPQLQRRAFPHEVESQTDKAIASTKPISADWQAQQEKIALARFNPGMISLYPANPLKEEKKKPVQRKVDSIVESDETQTKPIQRRVESPPEADEGQAESIQRKTESTAQDELEKDKPSSNKLVQTKLSVGKVGDRYEQEADQVAAKVMTMPDPSRNRIQRQTEDADIQPKSLANTITPLVQRQSDEEVQTKSGGDRNAQNQSVNAEFENRLAGSKASGSPLPGEVRSFMEPRFGVDLSHVRVNTGADSAQMNKDVRAQAFAYRNHIFYAAGKAPAKDDLTAHELTHVIQQTGGKSLNKEVRRSPESDNQEPIQAKSLESSSTDIANNKLTPAESSIQRHDISLISPQIQRNPLGLLGDVVTGDLEGARRRLLDSVAGFASGMPGYPLLTVILGKDPIKDQPVERNATNLVRGVLSLVPGGDRLFQNLQESGALQKAFDWFDQQIRLLNLTWDTIKTLFRRAIDSLSPSDIFNPVGAIERLVNIFRDPINRIIRFALNVGQKVMEFVFEGAMALAGKGGVDQVMGILKKLGGLFMKIVQDPIAFVGNLVQSVKGGFEQFSDHIVAHLKAGLMGWLLGALSGSGLQIPSALNAKGMLSIALQVVGATYQNLRKKLVRRLGEKRVSQVEKTFELLRTIATGGLIAAWQQISQSVGDIKEMILSEVRNWVITTIIKQAVIKLVSMFNPAGAIVQAVIAVYNTVMFFIERWQQILELANAVFNSINSIAAGKIGAAIKFVEQSMAKSLPVIISFMARLLGLGGISNKIRNIIKRMQKPIDQAMNKIIDIVMKFAKKLFGKDKKGKDGKKDDRTVKQKESDLRKALSEVHQLLKNKKTPLDQIKKRLPKIKSRYKMKSLELVVQSKNKFSETVYAKGLINPDNKTPTVTRGQIERLSTLARQVADSIRQRGEVEVFCKDPVAYFNSPNDQIQKGKAVEAAGLTEVLRHAPDCTVLTNVELFLANNAGQQLSNGSIAELDFLILSNSRVKEIISAKFNPQEYKPSRDLQMLRHFYAMKSLNIQEIHQYALRNFGSRGRGTPRWFQQITDAFVRFSHEGFEQEQMSISTFAAKYLNQTPVEKIVVKSLSPKPELDGHGRPDIPLSLTSSELRDEFIGLIKKNIRR